jgi:rhamnosyltransferase subunit B
MGTNINSRLKVLLPTLGSAGDVHPVIALGIGLQARGHQATVITNEFFGEQIRKAGLGFIAMGTIQEAEEAIADPRLWHPTKSFECVAERAINPNISRLYEILRDHHDANTVVAASGICFGARIAQEKLGIPLATVHLQPAMFRSMLDSGHQGRIPMGVGMPGPLKKAVFWLIDTLWIDRLLAPPINAFRAQLGLPPVKGILGEYAHSPQLVIALFPEWFAPPQPDWPANTHLVGFVLHDASEHYQVPREVEDFLAAGPTPVVFTPGSAAATLTGFFRESVETCRLGGFRAMLVTNFAGQLPADLPSGIRAFPYLPFGQVLPSCAALVYPGGIGTLAQTIKAGIPHLAVPHGHDQPDNGARVERLGLGLRIYSEKYKARAVARMLGELLGSSAIQHRCREYATRIDSQAALQRACDLIEQLGR